MADESSLQLLCLVPGDPEALRVQVPFRKHVSDLKELIWKKGQNSIFNKMDARQLTLFKVRLIRGSSPIKVAEWALS
jgi:hypothetical protein